MPGSRCERGARRGREVSVGGGWAVSLVLTVAWLAACPKPPSQGARHFSPHEWVARAEGVEAELVSVVYGESTTDITLTIRNRGNESVGLDDRSVLLDFEQLAYTPVNTTGTLQILAGQARSLTLHFSLGRPFHGPASLSLRHLQRLGRWLPDLTVPIPPQSASPTGPAPSPSHHPQLHSGTLP